MKRWLCFLGVLVLSAGAFAGEVYVKSKVHTDTIKTANATIPARDEIVEQWIGDGFMAYIGGKRHSIVDIKNKTMYLINPHRKNYVQMELPLDLKKILPKEMAPMAEMMKPVVSVVPTKETKKIGKWNCVGYDLTIGMMGNTLKSRVWATKDVPIDLAKYRELYSHILKTQFIDENSLKELDKIEGFQILSETEGEMMGAKLRTRIEVTEVAVKNAPAGTFRPPEGYTAKASLDLEDFGN